MSVVLLSLRLLLCFLRPETRSDLLCFSSSPSQVHMAMKIFTDIVSLPRDYLEMLLKRVLAGLYGVCGPGHCASGHGAVRSLRGRRNHHVSRRALLPLDAGRHRARLWRKTEFQTCWKRVLIAVQKKVALANSMKKHIERHSDQDGNALKVCRHNALRTRFELISG